VALSCFRIPHPRFLHPRHVLCAVRWLRRVRGHCCHFRRVRTSKVEEGSVTRMSARILLSDLVAEHNRGGKHLELHQPVCLEYQFKDGVVFGAYSTPMMLLHNARGINSQWPFLAGFDTTFGISSNKFEMLCMNVNSLRRKANPVCLAITKMEEAVAYQHVFYSTEAGVFDLVHNLKLCKTSKKCEMCNAVREQILQKPMRNQFTPPSKPRKTKQGEEIPFKFELPLDKPMRDNTTKFSKWIKKKKPHLADKILQCAAHLTAHVGSACASASSPMVYAATARCWHLCMTQPWSFLQRIRNRRFQAMPSRRSHPPGLSSLRRKRNRRALSDGACRRGSWLFPRHPRYALQYPTA
jgi:hypothetical protein